MVPEEWPDAGLLGVMREMITERSLDERATAYFTEYLKKAGTPLAAVALDELQNVDGGVAALVPTEADEDVVYMFGSARALHPPYRNSTVEQWLRVLSNESYSAAPTPKRVATEIVGESLANTKGWLVCQNGLPSIRGQRRPLVEVARLDGCPALLGRHGLDKSALSDLLNGCYVMGTFVAAVVHGIPEEAVAEHAFATQLLARRLTLVMVEAYDGEGVLLWRVPEREG